jgi:hypothetical protein
VNTDTEFFRAFAGRVRQQLADTPKGGTTMSTTQPLPVETTAVPATFQAAPDAPCAAHAWCVETGQHLDHMGRRVAMHNSDGAELLTAYLYTDQPTGLPALSFDPGMDDWNEYTSGDQLRAQTAKVRAHLARLDAFADEFDAVIEAAAGAPTGQEPVPVYEPDKIQRVTVEEATLTPGSAALYKQYGDLLRVAYDPAEQPLSAVAAMVGLQLGERVERLILASATEGARRWSITTTTGVTVTGHLPGWAETDPSQDGVPHDRLQTHVADIHHSQWFTGQTVTVDMPGFDHDRYIGEYEALVPTMRCLPHSDDPADRVPVVVVDAVAGSDHYIGPLDPDGVADLAAKLRAQADRLTNEVLPALVAAREDWDANGGAR